MNKFISSKDPSSSADSFGITRPKLMTHVVAGYPNIEETRKIILTMVEEGVDFIEIQIPFSDPLGDGATIRVANTIALEHGFKVADFFELIQKLRTQDHVKIPLLCMTYFNIVHHYGVEKFCAEARKVGIDGLIIPDYGFEAEAHEKLFEIGEKNGLYIVPFVSLDSSTEYIEQLALFSTGFIYCFAQRSVTGAKNEISYEFVAHIKKIKQILKIPLAVGFGISEPQDIERIQGLADIAIVGSALLREYDRAGVSGVREKVRGFVQAGGN